MLFFCGDIKDGRTILLCMLEQLRVKNLAIVEDVFVELGPGLNVITGETGAGKSVVVGALGLVLGGRADKSLVRTGEEKCIVEAVFAVDTVKGIGALLDELDIASCDDNKLIVRRTVAISGSGRNFVNDCPVTVQALKRIGDMLVDMHGPHDHQSLLNNEFQLLLLDAFGRTDELRAAYQNVYGELMQLGKERTGLESGDQEVERELDMLSFQIKEIESADLADEDEAGLESELTVVANATRILESGSGICAALTEEERSAFECMVEVQRHLNEISGVVEEAEEWQKEAEAIAIQLQELSATIGSYAQSVETDPSRQQTIEDRLALIHGLKRKYGGDIGQIQGFLAKATARHHELAERGERLESIDQAIAKCQSQLAKEGAKLHLARVKNGKVLAATITKELRALGFEHGVFDVDVNPCDPGPNGCDHIEFGFAPNAGEAMRSLKTIASSGEISRVMLATKAVLAGHDSIPVLVFDEIDANVGGETGNAVGAKLAAVAQSHQVLCITHLPQVAVFGRQHHVVEKSVEQGRTHTALRAVSGNARVEEVARMLGGKGSTSVAIKHAKEMLANAQG